MILKKIILRIKWLFHDLTGFLGIPFKLRKSAGELRVLCFHGVCPDSEAYINSRFLHHSSFVALLEALQQHFNIISLQDFLGNNLDQSRLNVLITFDDGYRNNKSLVLPELEKRSIPATIFCVNRENLPIDLLDIAQIENLELNPIEGKSSPNELKMWAIQQSRESLDQLTLQLLENEALQSKLDDYKAFHELLSEDDLKELQQHNLISIANHGGAHISYLNQPKEFLSDYSEGKSRIESIGSQYGNVFAYPFGHHSIETQKSLEELGCKAQFITAGDPNHIEGVDDRIVINPYISVRNQLIAIRNGKY